MMKEQLIHLLEAYRSLGIVKGGELCLPPHDALRLADDLEAIGVVVMGLDGWYYIDQDKGMIAQDLSVDLYVGDDVLRSSNSVHNSISIVKDFISTRLPERIAFVSFTLDVPSNWGLFPQ